MHVCVLELGCWCRVGCRWGGVARCCLVAGGAAAGCCCQRAVCPVEFGCWCSSKLVRKLGPDGYAVSKKGNVWLLPQNIIKYVLLSGVYAGIMFIVVGLCFLKI